MGARLKQLLQQDRLIHVYGLGQLLGPKFVEIIALHGGFDAVWFDIEHAGVTTSQIEQASLAARAHGLDSFVRLTPTDYASMMRPLEAGAGGVMAAQVRSAVQTEEIIRWVKFHPRGLRGYNGLGVDGEYGRLGTREYIEKANLETFVAIQIEHFEAVDDIDRIAAVPDVDVLFLGPADLSQSMGMPGEWERPEMWRAIERVASAAKRNGIHWALVPKDVAYARRCVELGCKMLCVGFDASTIWAGLQATQRQFAEFFPGKQ
jgi:2-dehydro-3-deoxyglucarate aldolase/4-hydroxy-2-oxoheptanedioate aldolase